MSGKAVILCAPSGSGKTTLAKFLLSNEKLNLRFSVSATTREMRINEQDGIDYNFLEINNFKNKINNGEFIAIFVLIGYWRIRNHEKFTSH